MASEAAASAAPTSGASRLLSPVRALCIVWSAFREGAKAAYSAFVAELQRGSLPPQAVKQKQLNIQTPNEAGPIGGSSSSRPPRPPPVQTPSPVPRRTLTRSHTTPLNTSGWLLERADSRGSQSFTASPKSRERHSMVTFASPMEQAMTVLRRLSLQTALDASVQAALDEAIELIESVASASVASAGGFRRHSALTRVDVANELARHAEEAGEQALDSETQVPSDCLLIAF